MCYFDGHIRDLGKLPESHIQNLMKMINASPQLWSEANATNPNKFRVFQGNTDHIVFQFPIDRQDHENSEYFPWWCEWQNALISIIKASTQGYLYTNGKTSRIMLARLAAGKRCKMHVDHTPSANIPHKIHVPLQTHQNVQFIEEGDIYYLEYGRAYEVNNKVIHGTNNPSLTDRIHLIFDYYNG